VLVLIYSRLLPTGRKARLTFLAATVPLKRSRSRELTKFVPYHVFSHQNFDMLTAIVDKKSVSDKFRNHGASPSPRFNGFF
jgi:hypothetical protein